MMGKLIIKKLPYEIIRLFRPDEREVSLYQNALDMRLTYYDDLDKNPDHKATYLQMRKIPVCNVPYVLREIGIPDGNILMEPYIVGKTVGIADPNSFAQNLHDIPMEVLEDLPRQICDPVAVTASKNGASILIITEHKIDDKPIVAALQMDFREKSEPNIVSIHTRTYIDKSRPDYDEDKDWAADRRYLYIRRDPASEVIPRNYPVVPPAPGHIENVISKRDLVNKFRQHRQERIFLAGIDPLSQEAEKQYMAAEKALFQRGFRIENPFKTIRATLAQLDNCTAIVTLCEKPALIEGLDIERVTQIKRLPCTPVKALLPEQIHLEKFMERNNRGGRER